MTLALAIPSKGRLQEHCHSYLRAAGLAIDRPGGARQYRGSISGSQAIDIAFMPAADIAAELAQGRIHFGVTGLDLICEHEEPAQGALYTIERLGFGHTELVVAVPESWIDVDTMMDLADAAHQFRLAHNRRMRVASKHVRLARQFLATHKIHDCRLVESIGATEAGPAAGTADFIIDLSSSGETLRANHLKTLDDGLIVRSQACLCAATHANWTSDALAGAKMLLLRVGARAAAQRQCRITAHMPDLAPEQCAPLEGGLRALGVTFPFGAPSAACASVVPVGDASVGSGAVELHCPRTRRFECVDILRDYGAQTIELSTPDLVFEAGHRLFDALFAQIRQSGTV